VFNGFEELGVNDEAKHQFFLQVKHLNESYPGGLAAYITNARKLLASAKNGENPLEGWVPEVPQGVTLEPMTPEYEDYEKAGFPEVGATGFVLVAGGLGERLGYNGIKVELPVETTTGRTYLELYCRQILAMQQRYARPAVKLPLAIMTSDDTQEKTVALLENNDYFGLDKEQVSILKQEKVPALLNNDADIAMAGPYTIDAKVITMTNDHKISVNDANGTVHLRAKLDVA
jgi:UDP-sugar pyrophosphorylase